VVVVGWFWVCWVSGVAVAGSMSKVVRRSRGMIFFMSLWVIFFLFPFFYYVILYFYLYVFC